MNFLRVATNLDEWAPKTRWGAVLLFVALLGWLVFVLPCVILWRGVRGLGRAAAPHIVPLMPRSVGRRYYRSLSQEGGAHD